MGLTLLWLIPFGSNLQEDYSSSRRVFSRDNKLLRMTLSTDETYRLWKPLKQIPDSIKGSFLLKEDRYFYFHPGFNPISLLNSAYETYIKRSGVYGGSTITMQLARLHFKINSRSLFGKVKQILAATYLEFAYTKNEILEAWLNLIPMGRNIEGVAAGAQIYFQKSLEKLNLTEILFLAVIPQNPSELNSQTPTGEIPKKLRNKRDLLFQKSKHRYPKEQREKFTSLFKMPFQISQIKDLPFKAPHFSTELLGRHKKRDIYSTLDLNLQRLLEKKIKSYVRRNNKMGIKNAVALLVHSKSREILASVGSADFFNESISGQVNGVNAKRSPGSTLKPLLFALGFDQGVLTPQSLMIDGPTNFISPKNFDQSLMGPISAERALYLSRNIPAADLLRKVKKPYLYDVLKTLGISNLRSKDSYGTSLILGALELTPKEIAFLYTIIAENGISKPLRSTLTEMEMDSTPILSSAAAVMVKDIMMKTPRPDIQIHKSMLKNNEEVAWKTGTSFGFRDAWTAGIYGPYTLVTWVGDFQGSSQTPFIGQQQAAPLFFEIIDALKGRGDKKYNHTYAKNLTEVEVCHISGNLPGKFCPKTKSSLFIPGVSPIHKCKIHREVMVNVRTGLRACPETKEKVIPVTYEFWPSHVTKLFKAKGLDRKTAPHYGPECKLDHRHNLGIAPKILSPKLGVSYQAKLKKGFAKIPFKVEADADVKQVFWYKDKSFLGSSRAQKTKIFNLGPGRYTIKVVDDQGRVGTRNIQVNLIN